MYQVANTPIFPHFPKNFCKLELMAKSPLCHNHQADSQKNKNLHIPIKINLFKKLLPYTEITDPDDINGDIY
jgi:hypothetical protein